MKDALNRPHADPADTSDEVQDAVHEAPRLAFAHLRHELRTPLNQIIGFSDLLLEDAEAAGDESRTRDLAKIKAAGLHVLQLINDILDFQKTPDGHPAPPAPHEAAAPVNAPVAPTEKATETATLLVVDDEEINRDLLCRRLERQGYRTLSAEDGPSALATLAREPCDLLLLDILMPGMDGFQVLERLKADAALRHVPVIVISALDDLDSVVRGIAMGAEDYLPKPFSPVLLRARIGASLEKKRLSDAERRLYRELEENYNRLRALERLRDDLTHMIVHDLRQPMTAFLTGLRMVEIMGPLNPQQAECLGVATAGGEMLIAMVNDLLDIGKMEAGALTLLNQEVHIDKVFEQAEQQMAWLARDRCLKLERKVAAGVPVLHGDEEKLRRALVNLLGNAVKFTPEGGAIIMTAHRGGDEVILSVRDTGEGIPKEAFGRIFEKFGQVELRREGQMMSTGLGLTFCKMVAEAHGGRIWVESEAGLGSIFSIALPVG